MSDDGFRPALLGVAYPPILGQALRIAVRPEAFSGDENASCAPVLYGALACSIHPWSSQSPSACFLSSWSRLFYSSGCSDARSIRGPPIQLLGEFGLPVHIGS
jgi:hypothetical protein